jgi:hypothetical protein
VVAPNTEHSILSPIQRLVHWLQDWRERQAEMAELDGLGEEGLREIAADLGLSTAQLRDLASQGPHAADLMPRLMTALGLDPDMIRQAEPMVFRDMQRTCSGCSDKSRCAHDLNDGAIQRSYREFCPNADTLSALEAERIEEIRAGMSSRGR